MNKNELREKYIKIRKAISDKENKSNIIASILLDELRQNNYLDNNKYIALYFSKDDEVNTKNIILKLISLDYKICLPRVSGEHLDFYLFDSFDNLEISLFKVMEPKIQKEKLVSLDDISIMVVPGVCFDVYGNRIGYGKGFYDKVITNKVITIGICFDEQIYSDKIDAEYHDKKIDIVITDKRIIKKKSEVF